MKHPHYVAEKRVTGTDVWASKVIVHDRQPAELVAREWDAEPGYYAQAWRVNENGSRMVFFPSTRPAA